MDTFRSETVVGNAFGKKALAYDNNYDGDEGPRGR